MVTTFRPISGPIWRAATYLSSMAGSSRSPITGATSPPSISIAAAMSRSTSCSPFRATSRPQACMNHWASPRSIRPTASPSRSTSAAKPACPASTPPATSPTPSCPQSRRHHRTARWRVSSPSSRCWFERDWRMSMAIEPDSAGVRFPPPLIYLGALLLGLAAERFVTLRSFGIDPRLLVATGALLFVAGAAIMLAAAGLFRRLGTNIPPSQPTTLIATTGPYRWTRNPMYLGMALIYAGLAIGFDGPMAFAMLPLVLIAIQTQVIAREERYLEAKFGEDRKSTRLNSSHGYISYAVFC